MYKEGKSSNLEEGWKLITDMLRCTTTCKDSEEVLNILSILANNKVTKILKIDPKFGPKRNNANEIIINFDYEGLMICEM